MATDGIKISFAEVSKTAESIRSANKKLRTDIDQVKTEMDRLSQVWESDASETIRTKFKALAENYVEYETVIGNYAKFLDETVQHYLEVEKVIDSNANLFK